MAAVRCILADHAPALQQQRIQRKRTVALQTGDLLNDGRVLETPSSSSPLSVYNEPPRIRRGYTADAADVLQLAGRRKRLSVPQRVSFRKRADRGPCHLTVYSETEYGKSESMASGRDLLRHIHRKEIQRRTYPVHVPGYQFHSCSRKSRSCHTYDR